MLLGPTGAGKTTTLRLVAGPREARRRRDLDRRPRRDARSAGDARRHLRLPAIFALSASHASTTISRFRCARRRGDAGSRDRKRVEQTRGAAAHRRASSSNRATRLSGGEMQRVAIGRALVREPAIYLMDEPLSSLDAKLRAELRLELKRIQRELGATILYVTHDQIEAMTMATAHRRDRGRAASCSSARRARSTRRPTNVYVAARLGTAADQFPSRAACFPSSRCRRGPETIGVRTEHLQIVKRATAAACVGRVHRIEHLGDQNHLHVDISRRDARDAGRSASSRSAPATTSSRSLSQPLYFDASGTTHRRDDSLRMIAMSLQPETFKSTGQGGRGAASSPARRRADRARSGHRRRRSRHQHEARLRGGAGQSRRDRRAAARRGAQGARQDAGDDGRRRLRARSTAASSWRSARHCSRDKRLPDDLADVVRQRRRPR